MKVINISFLMLDESNNANLVRIKCVIFRAWSTQLLSNVGFYLICLSLNRTLGAHLMLQLLQGIRYVSCVGRSRWRVILCRPTPIKMAWIHCIEYFLRNFLIKYLHDIFCS